MRPLSTCCNLISSTPALVVTVPALLQIHAFVTSTHSTSFRAPRCLVLRCRSGCTPFLLVSSPLPMHMCMSPALLPEQHVGAAMIFALISPFMHTVVHGPGAVFAPLPLACTVQLQLISALLSVGL